MGFADMTVFNIVQEYCLQSGLGIDCWWINESDAHFCALSKEVQLRRMQIIIYLGGLINLVVGSQLPFVRFRPTDSGF